VEVVVTELKGDVLQDEQTGGHSDGQTEQVDARKRFVPEQVAPGNLEIILQHDQTGKGLGRHPAEGAGCV